MMNCSTFILFIFLINICGSFVIYHTSNREGKELLNALINQKLYRSNKVSNKVHVGNTKSKEFRRRHHKQSKSKFDGQELYNLLSDDLKNDDFKKWLRQQYIPSLVNERTEEDYTSTTPFPPIGLHKREQISILEDEIKNSIVNNDTLLYNRPYIEHHGLNDFIVMKPGSTDMFVTVIPNDIYYNIEKKCVNWLDNCDLQGIRQELLTKFRTP